MADAPRVELYGTDLAVYPLCLGGNVFGWTADEAESFAVLDAYFDAGGNFIDTADQYSDWVPGNSGGESETIIGRWMAARGVRSEMVIATKVGSAAGVTDLTPEVVRAGIAGSLERLQTDYVDIYYIHRDRPTTRLDEVLAAMNRLVDEGRVRHIGASNFSVARLQEALDICADVGYPSFAAFQPPYNLMDRGVEGGLLSLCRRVGISCVPYYGLASGFLSGKYRHDTAPPASPRAGRARSYLAEPRGQAVLAALGEVARAQGVPMAAIALAWVEAQPGVATPVASARSVAQLSDLLAFPSVELGASELDRLTAASATA